MRSADVVVLGGGVIGCAVAYHLAARGARVTLVERDVLGTHASGAAAGMFAPFAEAAGDGPFFDLCERGLDALTNLLPCLAEETGLAIEHARCGLLRLAAGPEEASELRVRAARLARYGVCWLEAAAARRLQPGLGEWVAGALHSQREGYVASRDLVQAFWAGAAGRGAQLLEGTAVTGFLRSGERVTGVRSPRGDLPAGAVVVAAGAWAGTCGEWVGRPLPVRPVRGQILALEPPRGSVSDPMPRRILWGSGVYLVPRADGSVVVGATEEDAGFDARVTVSGLGGLLAAAPRLMPALATATFGRAWAGLRPGTPDRRPLLGPLAGLPGLFVATGHYRNGILLSALTGQLLAECVLSRPPEVLRPFAPERFMAPGP